MAARFLTEHGYGAQAVGPVWEAIALHATPGIAERRGVLAYLTRRGIGVDFGIGADFVTDAQAAAVHSNHPRLNMVTALVDDIVRHAARSPQAGARYTLGGEFVRERAEPGAVTFLERTASTSRWGT